MVTIEKQRTLQIQTKRKEKKESPLLTLVEFFLGDFCAQIPPVVSRSSLATIPSGMSREDDGGRSHSTKRGAFHEIFNLPETERPLPGALKKGIVNSVSTWCLLFETYLKCSLFCVDTVCENGWRCCLINRDRKIPTDYIRNGLLYVTEK